MATVRLRNTNPMGEVYLHLIGRELERGEEFDIDANLAGFAPGTITVTDEETGEETEVYDAGEGLLAQVGNYELVKDGEA